MDKRGEENSGETVSPTWINTELSKIEPAKILYKFQHP
jgi:hypothetical protein